MITSSEAVPCAKVKILTERRSSKFKKGGLEVGDTGFIKAVLGDPWKNNSDLIWVTKDGKRKSKSYGFRPENLELIEQIKKEQALPGTEVIVKQKRHGVSMSKCGLKPSERLYITRIVGNPWEDESDNSYIETSRILGDKKPSHVFNFKPEDLKAA